RHGAQRPQAGVALARRREERPQAALVAGDRRARAHRAVGARQVGAGPVVRRFASAWSRAGPDRFASGVGTPVAHGPSRPRTGQAAGALPASLEASWASTGSRYSRARITSEAVSGSAISNPNMPIDAPPAMMARMTTTGCRPRLSPRILGSRT